MILSSISRMIKNKVTIINPNTYTGLSIGFKGVFLSFLATCLDKRQKINDID